MNRRDQRDASPSDAGVRVGIRRFDPWLRKSHPNFFVIFAGTAVAQLWFAAISILSPERYNNPALRQVNEFAAPQVWGTGALVIGLLLVQGMWNPSFHLARIALALGFFGCLLRFMLLVGADVAGASPPAWFLIACLHLSQTLEPPYNPASGR